MILRQYQKDIATRGVEILKDHGILYLMMQVRTGKTATSLHTVELYGAKSVLFLTKKKAISSIEDDAAALSVPFTLTVVNYEQLHNYTGTPDLVICDEAHCLGAFPRPAERTKELRKMIGTTPVIMLSGSPTPESFSQMFHQMWISARSPWNAYPSFYKWAADYVKIKQRKFAHGMVNDYSKADQPRIEADIKHLVLSFSQEQAGFTELVQEEIMHVRMADTTYRLIDKLIAARVVMNKEGEAIVADTAVKLMQKLHQICSGTVLVDSPERIGKVFDYAKAHAIRDRFAGHKIAIFYKYIAERAMLQYVFAGRWTDDPDEFRQSTDKVFISQIISGREGINLSTADALVMLNIDFSHVSYIQARARLQSKDRSSTARVVWVFAEHGIEEKIYHVVQAKKDYQSIHFNKDYGVQNTIGHPPQARVNRMAG
jgi:hypothetical protein